MAHTTARHWSCEHHGAQRQSMLGAPSPAPTCPPSTRGHEYLQRSRNATTTSFDAQFPGWVLAQVSVLEVFPTRDCGTQSRRSLGNLHGMRNIQRPRTSPTDAVAQAPPSSNPGAPPASSWALGPALSTSKPHGESPVEQTGARRANWLGLLLHEATATQPNPGKGLGMTESFSILTPSYNYARFIGDAIESVRRQATTMQVDHIVQDGASDDGTIEVLRRFDDVIWDSRPDSGQSDALNKALTQATGSVVGWLNADEFYLEDTLDSVSKAFRDHDPDVVFGDSVFVDPEGKLLRLVPQHAFDEFILRNHGCYIPSCAFFVRRRVLETRPWDPLCRYIMDWDLYLNLASKGARYHYLPRPLGAFRVHEARVTATPLASNSDERLHVMRRHGISTSQLSRHVLRSSARLKRIAIKVRSGAYLRQLRLSRQAGADMRWWDIDRGTKDR